MYKLGMKFLGTPIVGSSNIIIAIAAKQKARWASKASDEGQYIRFIIISISVIYQNLSLHSNSPVSSAENKILMETSAVKMDTYIYITLIYNRNFSPR